MRLLALLLTVLLNAPPAAGNEVARETGPRLAPPVDGALARAFSYAGDPFARGHHRGIDLAAAPGDPVRAACSGRVTFAGRAGAGGGAVALRCGAWSVTLLPLRALAVRAGGAVAAGAEIGEAGAARGHAGLHLGVRRADDRFGYVDPAPLLGAPAPPVPPAAPPRSARPQRGPPAPRPAPMPSRPAPRPHPAPSPLGAAPAAPLAPAARPGSSPSPHRSPHALAPWPAWAGLALLLSGAVGAGSARVARKRRAPLARTIARELP